ncbi:hypothetical protein [Ectopseudomonas toyotomiensis]|uniref:Uncharacterized protein n=1 Tax=Ectopseudomonas toyotomiensis TaxID=554344 RepID=A0AA42IHE2_9GAMM|nr:hypothetical protein [Pseudomonas toyotomiensis]MBG0838998.1 hypothetical protein [Pseudomonas toyotomiensis]MDH0699927.1 hypothetical protein [Pseudomonas toyotomiensis]
MHHETTLNLPSPSSKEVEREWLADRVAEFQARGAQAIEVPIEKRPLVSGQWRSPDMTIITESRRHEQAAKAHRKAGGRPIGTVVEDSPALIRRARALAGLGIAKSTAAKRLQIGVTRLERMAEKHGFEFATKSPKAA